MNRAERLAEEKQGFEKLISEQQHMGQSTKTEERQTLAQLRTVEAEGRPSIIPNIRTGVAINRKLWMWTWACRPRCWQVSFVLGTH